MGDLLEASKRNINSLIGKPPVLPVRLSKFLHSRCYNKYHIVFLHVMYGCDVALVVRPCLILFTKTFGSFSNQLA
jgi:hypothetical protein